MKKTIRETYQDPRDAELDIADSQDVRRPRMTFRHLNRIRTNRKVRDIELKAQQKLVRTMYGGGGGDSGGDF